MSDESSNRAPGAIDRRGLGRLLAMSALSAGVAAPAVLAQDRKPPAVDDAQRAAAEEAGDKNPLASASVAVLLGEIVRRRSNGKLTGDDLASVERDLDRALRRSQALSKTPLVNSDEPAVVFRAYRGPDLPKL